MLFQFGTANTQIIVVGRRFIEECCQRRNLRCGKLGATNFQRGIRPATHQLVKFQQGFLHFHRSLARFALDGDFCGLDDFSLQHRSHTAWIALHDHIPHGGESVGDFRSSSRVLLLGGQGVGENLDPCRQIGAETRQPEFGKGDIAVGYGLPQSEASPPLDGLGQCDRIGDPLSLGVAAAHTFVAKIEIELWIGELSGRSATCLGNGDFRLIEFNLRIARQGLGYEAINGERDWRGLGPDCRNAQKGDAKSLAAKNRPEEWFGWCHGKSGVEEQEG